MLRWLKQKQTKFDVCMLGIVKSRMQWPANVESIWLDCVRGPRTRLAATASVKFLFNMWCKAIVSTISTLVCSPFSLLYEYVLSTVVIMDIVPLLIMPPYNCCACVGNLLHYASSRSINIVLLPLCSLGLPNVHRWCFAVWCLTSRPSFPLQDFETSCNGFVRRNVCSMSWDSFVYH